MTKTLLSFLLLTSSALAQISTGIINSVTVNGTVGWSATIANVQPPVTFWIDGISSWSEGVAPYEFKGIPKGLDTTKLTDGQHSLTVKAGTYSHTVVIDVRNAITPPPIPVPPPLPSDSYNLKILGAKGDGVTDDIAIIKSSLAKCKTDGKKLYVPPGRYVHSNNFDIHSQEMYGDGDTSEFVAANPLRSCIFLKGANPKLRNIKHSVNTTGHARQPELEKTNIAVYFCTGGFEVSNCTLVGSVAAGLHVWGATGTSGAYAKIVGNRVSNSLADGIHMSTGSSYINVDSNNVRAAQDDSIAIVSGTNTPQQRWFNIRNNDVGFTLKRGRGITVVGGEDITITGNRIEKTYQAGLLITSEAGWGTSAVNRVTTSDNIIIEAGIDPVTNHPGILIGGRSGYTVQNVTITNTTVTRPKSDGVRVDAYVGPGRITFTGTTITGVPTGKQAWVISTSAQPFVTVNP